MGIVDELKKKFNMSESKRRSQVGMDVAFWNSEAGGLGCSIPFSPIVSSGEYIRLSTISLVFLISQ